MGVDLLVSNDEFVYLPTYLPTSFYLSIYIGDVSNGNCEIVRPVYQPYSHISAFERLRWTRNDLAVGARV